MCLEGRKGEERWRHERERENEKQRQRLRKDEAETHSLLQREREPSSGSFVLRPFISFPKVGTLGEVPEEDLSGIFISFPGVPFLGHGHRSWS